MRPALAVSLLVLASLAAGCFGTDDDPPADNQAAPDARLPPPHVVVGDIDSGINVYHERFAGTIPDELLATFVDAATGEPPRRVQLTTTGDFEARLAADQKAVWDTLERGVLYYFEGTRVLGISFADDESDENPILDFPDGSHGTATSGSVLDANPEAILVLVEGGQGVGGPVGMLGGAQTGQGELWAMEQPWIDVTTMSYGPPGSPPTVALEESGTHAATRLGWRGGKLPVGAADNSPSPAPNDQTAGPPWVIGVAGDHVETQCRDHVSGTFPDVTANFTQTLPDADSVDARHSTSGTSFATPTTAGTLSAIVLGVRKAWEHSDGLVEGALAVGPDGQRITNVDVREAMNRTAYYFDVGACQAEPGTSTPVNPAAPWVQMGWGHVGPEIVEAAVAHLLGESPAAARAGNEAAFQQSVYEYRVRLWGEP